MTLPKGGENCLGVLLRDVLEADIPILFEHQNDPAAFLLAAFTPRDKIAFTEHWTKILADRTVAKKAILFDGRLVGNIVCFERSGLRQVGYWIDRDYWGRGIATRALSRFLVHVTERPLYALVAKHNAASIRVLEKCGFAIVGDSPECSDPRGPAVEEFTLKLGEGRGQET